MATEPWHPAARAGAQRSDPLQDAALALQAQRPQEAARIAEEVLRRDPRQARALYILGCALLMQGRPQDAVAPLESAARGGHNPDIDIQLALALSRTGRQNEALTLLKRTAKRKPPHAGALYTLGHLFLAAERYEEAIETLRRGCEIAPMMPEMSIQLGYALLHRGDYVAAKAAFGRALAILPRSPDALFGMGKAHYSSGEFNAAVGYFRQSLMSRPDDHNTWLLLGHCLLVLGERDAGYECFRTAARGDPKRYGKALLSLAASARGRAWMRPSAAARFLREGNSSS